ncbi:zinc ribbon domain-containing protein [Pseudonocardia asaccharolytica]|uniref:zinc ribbon domain-containing protein n=1 Tax=Pseudonocardia asaccharolytica TaxID=54010 RepID=UPI0035A23DF4
MISVTGSASVAGAREGGPLSPPSHLCSECGSINGPEPLSVRTWECSCGVHDRDLNAAKNILAAGRAERRNRGPDGPVPRFVRRRSVRPAAPADGNRGGYRPRTGALRRPPRRPEDR